MWIFYFKYHICFNHIQFVLIFWIPGRGSCVIQRGYISEWRYWKRLFMVLAPKDIFKFWTTQIIRDGSRYITRVFLWSAMEREPPLYITWFHVKFVMIPQPIRSLHLLMGATVFWYQLCWCGSLRSWNSLLITWSGVAWSESSSRWFDPFHLGRT